MTALIESVKTFIATYSGLESGAALLVNQLNGAPTQYSIEQLPGARIAETYITGKTLREYPFALSSIESNVDEAERIGNSGFYESFAEWLDTQSRAGTLPTLSATADGKTRTAVLIEALGWGIVITDGESGNAQYQIQCRLMFEQQA